MDLLLHQLQIVEKMVGRSQKEVRRSPSKCEMLESDASFWVRLSVFHIFKNQYFHKLEESSKIYGSAPSST